MKLYPTLLAISAGLCLMPPILRAARHLNEYGHLDYLLEDRFFIGTALSGLLWAPLLALIVWLPLKGIGAAGKRLRARGNLNGNEHAPGGVPAGNAGDVSAG